jgi:hypothetical protein
MNQGVVMFGVLYPATQYVSVEQKQQYESIYCNLCAALSATGVGPFNRFFLVHDLVTLGWLFSDEQRNNAQGFSCHNCVKGGVIGKKKLVSIQQTLLAALSTYFFGIKFNDNLHDNPSVIQTIKTWLYRPIMRKAERILKQYNLLDDLTYYVDLNLINEAQQIASLEKASEPTEKFYGRVTEAVGQYVKQVPPSLLQLMGRYLGRCVYILDAIKDMKEDKIQHQYNVLNLMMTNENMSEISVLKRCLDFLKPMRQDISKQLELLSNESYLGALRAKCDNLFISIEHQLRQLLIPFDQKSLLSTLYSFSVVPGCGGNAKIKIDDFTPPSQQCCPPGCKPPGSSS